MKVLKTIYSVFWIALGAASYFLLKALAHPEGLQHIFK